MQLRMEYIDGSQTFETQEPLISFMSQLQTTIETLAYYVTC